MVMVNVLSRSSSVMCSAATSTVSTLVMEAGSMSVSAFFSARTVRSSRSISTAQRLGKSSPSWTVSVSDTALV